MKQKEVWADQYWYESIKKIVEEEDSKESIKAKIRKNNMQKTWLSGFEFAMKIALNPTNNGFINWSNTEFLEQEIEKEVEALIYDDRIMEKYMSMVLLK